MFQAIAVKSPKSRLKSTYCSWVKDVYQPCQHQPSFVCIEPGVAFCKRSRDKNHSSIVNPTFCAAGAVSSRVSPQETLPFECLQNVPLGKYSRVKITIAHPCRSGPPPSEAGSQMETVTCPRASCPLPAPVADTWVCQRASFSSHIFLLASFIFL